MEAANAGAVARMACALRDLALADRAASRYVRRSSVPAPALIAVSAHDIDLAGVDVEAELPVVWLDHELGGGSRAQEPGHVRARLSRTGAEVVVRGRVTARLWLPCARCLEPAAADVDTELSLLLKPARPAAPAKGAAPPARSRRRDRDDSRGVRRHEPPEHEFSSDEASEDHYDGETVVLDDLVREAILLELPNFPLCSEACPGISLPARAVRGDTSSALEHDDPRLAPLRALRAQLAGPEMHRAGARSARPRLSTTHLAKSSSRKKKKKS